MSDTQNDAARLREIAEDLCVQDYSDNDSVAFAIRRETVDMLREIAARMETLINLLEEIDDVLIVNWVGPRKDGDYRKALANLISINVSETTHFFKESEAENERLQESHKSMLIERNNANAEVNRLKAELYGVAQQPYIAVDATDRDPCSPLDSPHPELSELRMENERLTVELAGYRGWSPDQFLRYQAQHRILQRAFIALDTKRAKLEAELAEAHESYRTKEPCGHMQNFLICNEYGHAQCTLCQLEKVRADRERHIEVLSHLLNTDPGVLDDADYEWARQEIAARKAQ